MISTVERRRHARPSIHALAWLRFHGERTVWATTTADLSEEGAQFISYTAVQPGAPVMVHLQPRGNMTPLECKGRIMWCILSENGLYRFGVRLLDVCDDERGLIRTATHGSVYTALQSA